MTKEKSADAYRQGRIALSEAAHQANLSLWDMESYLVEHGFTSSYSVEDLMEDAVALT